jgi:hypothetical protein
VRQSEEEEHDDTATERQSAFDEVAADEEADEERESEQESIGRRTTAHLTEIPLCGTPRKPQTRAPLV